MADAGHSHGFTPAAVQPKPNTVTLDAPITRGEQVINEITLRKPAAGELRGTSLNALVNLDVDALGKVLPRISSPTLTEFDVQQLDPADLVQLGVAFASFLLPKRAS
ncbi:phage tail protein [Burkholderia sp. A27]|nr:phage tail protein [Burkholderia sp. A27]